VISFRAVRSLRTSFFTAGCTSIALAAMLVACSSVPRRPGSSVETISPANASAKSPVDVVVAPIANPSGNASVPGEFLREAFHDGLVKRRYSPLALEYVDRKIVDASYTPGTLHEEAVLQLTIERWDSSLWETHRALSVRVAARLIDATRPGGGDLWAGRLERRFDVDKAGESTLGSDGLMKKACGLIAAELLAALPAREAVPGTGSSSR
jgi:hypothetical protein